ncbi:MAG: ester cyclase [Candidatus Binatus sp.]|uniref:ester cyclase n=1 Tax=Candidatus Binatus sp. TaxID=2811406 RepID=UPI003C74FD19
MSKEAKAVVRRFVEQVQDQHRLEFIDELFDPEYIDHATPGGMPPAAVKNPVDGFRQFFSGMLSAFPDLRVTVEDQIAEGDKVVTRKQFRGTHSGPFWGVAPSGKRLELEVIDIFRVRKGRLAEHWAQLDVMALLRQIGAGPPGR